jgi:hypothetical protein
MEKLVKLNFKGIEYIRLGSLTPIQEKSLKGSLVRNQIINIQVGPQILRDCVLYKSYEAWYEQNATLFSGGNTVLEPAEDLAETPLSTVHKIAVGS